MSTRVYYPRTTPSQRQDLFRVWEETGDLQQALETAQVSESTFYRWKPRFEEGGYSALEEFKSHAPKKPKRTAKAIEQKVIALKAHHPKWGKRRIADELAKANNCVPLVSPNTVRRILKDAGLWTTKNQIAKKGRNSQPNG